MSPMKPSTVSQPVSEPTRTDATPIGKIKKPYGDHYHKPRPVPDLVGPDLPLPRADGQALPQAVQARAQRDLSPAGTRTAVGWPSGSLAGLIQWVAIPR